MDLSKFETHSAALHSQNIDVVRRDLDGTPFDLAVINGRTKVWSERFHQIEPELLEWFERITPEHVLWDIGASIGHFSIYAALSTGCRVVGFEPEHQNFSVCALNHYLNRDALAGRFTPMNFGVAPTTSLSEMGIRLYGAGEHTKSLLKNDDATYQISILHMSLEQVTALGLPMPTHIKIDVDGAEQIVLEAIETLLPTIKSVFIELPLSMIDEVSERMLKHELVLEQTWDVARMRGGYYPDIRNLSYQRHDG